MTNNSEEKKIVTIGTEDTATIRNFFKHFKLKLPQELDSALNAFDGDKTFENQEKIKTQLATAIVKDDSGLFKDIMFAPLNEESTKIAYYHQFDTDLNETIKK